MIALNILSFGAIGDGKKDNTAAINQALQVGKAQQQPVLVPCGVFAYSDVLTADAVELYGEGDDSVLHALNVTREAIYLRGFGAAVRHLKLSGVVPTERMSPWECSRVVAREGATHFVIEGVCVDTSSAAGLVAEGASQGRIVGNRVSNTLADAIHMTNKSNRITVERNVVVNAGDDGIACVSYRGNGGMVCGIIARHNTISDSVHGRCMSVVGGSDILYDGNMLSGNPYAAGIYLAQENSWDTYGVHDVVMRRNSLHNVGNVDKGHYAVMVFSDGNEPNSDITVERCVITQDDERGGIRVFGDCTGVKLDANVIACANPLKIQIPDVVVTPYADGAVGIPW